MTRLIVWAAAATAVEVAVFAGAVHALLRHAMLERGLPTWQVGDTLRTSPLLWIGATLVVAGLNRAMALVALRAGPGAAEASGGGGVAVAAVVALLGVAIGWFGLRAVGKLY
jgi:hypothetical protein